MLFYALLAISSIALAALSVAALHGAKRLMRSLAQRSKSRRVRVGHRAIAVSERSALDPETLQARYRHAPSLAKPWGW